MESEVEPALLQTYGPKRMDVDGCGISCKSNGWDLNVETVLLGALMKRALKDIGNSSFGGICKACLET